MIYTHLTKKAINIMFDAHMTQKDKGGLPYVFHPYEVANNMDDETSTCVALLHDVIEDTKITLEFLENCGFPPAVVEAVGLLTKPSSLSYEKYIHRLKCNPVAVKVKLADLYHNSQISRIDNPSEEDIKRIQKYKEAIAILENKESNGFNCAEYNDEDNRNGNART